MSTNSNNKFKSQFVNLQKELINMDNHNPKNLIEVCKKKPFSIFMMFLSSCLFTFAITVILAQSKTIPSGLTAIPTLITYIFSITKPYFSFIYLLLNLPLIIIFWKSIKKSFLYLTIIWMIFQNLWNLFFNIEIIKNFLIYHISITSESWNINKALESNSDLWQIIYYTVFGSVLIGTSIGISWKFGGSTGGTDFISYYYSTKKRKPIGKILFIISISIALFSLITFGSLGHFNIGEGRIYRILGIQVISTILYIFITSIIVNLIYPKYKKVAITIYCSEPQKIMNHLKEINYWHSYNLWVGQSGYTGKETYKIKTIALYLEVKMIVSELRKVDPKIWISLKPVIETSGLFDTSRIE
ncbi:YitT family protein [Mesomycoplasma molare]|uniref:YitT family protein n=1 Tax=Mesomycoplasma molare TaxID=171288 RepID=A0ABY5TTX7_9BACT|nr:YitT family protein [Mesomycoplasma molare]UWD34115.1 YitT family protein [Mesomycoplasma molare]